MYAMSAIVNEPVDMSRELKAKSRPVTEEVQVMGKHNRIDDGALKARPAIAEALRQQGYEQEVHWVLRQPTPWVRPTDGGAQVPECAQGTMVENGGATQIDRGFKCEDPVQPAQTPGDQKTSDTEVAAHAEASSESDEKGKGSPMSEAERKAKQRRQAAREGWKEITVKAPKAQDARDLVTEFARMIFDDETRSIMRFAVVNQRLILLGQKVDRLTGLRRILVHRLLG